MGKKRGGDGERKCKILYRKFEAWVVERKDFLYSGSKSVRSGGNKEGERDKRRRDVNGPKGKEEKRLIKKEVGAEGTKG